jgi:hypothetical protein
VSRDYVITRQGRAYVLFSGLLVEAHLRGVRGIRVTMVQLPSPANGSWAICRAEVLTPAGRFSSLGDARPGNVGRIDVSSLIAAAQIRAKAHALCDALNLDLTPIEDLPGYVPDWIRLPHPPYKPAW